MGETYIKLGLNPGNGRTYFLPRLVGSGLACWAPPLSPATSSTRRGRWRLAWSSAGSSRRLCPPKPPHWRPGSPFTDRLALEATKHQLCRAGTLDELELLGRGDHEPHRGSQGRHRRGARKTPAAVQRIRQKGSFMIGEKIIVDATALTSARELAQHLPRLARTRFGHQYRAPFAAMMLGDMGADVIKIERPPNGDDTRTLRHFGGTRRRCSWRSIAASAVCCSTSRRLRGAPRRRGAAESADVVLESFPPDLAEKLGLRFEDCERTIHESCFAACPRLGTAPSAPRSRLRRAGSGGLRLDELHRPTGIASGPIGAVSARLDHGHVGTHRHHGGPGAPRRGRRR